MCDNRDCPVCSAMVKGNPKQARGTQGWFTHGVGHVRWNPSLRKWRKKVTMDHGNAKDWEDISCYTASGGCRVIPGGIRVLKGHAQRKEVTHVSRTGGQGQGLHRPKLSHLSLKEAAAGIFRRSVDRGRRLVARGLVDAAHRHLRRWAKSLPLPRRNPANERVGESAEGPFDLRSE